MGKVSITANPSFEIMMAMAESGNELTDAQAWALFALNRIHKEFKSKEQSKIILPKIGY